MSLTFNKNIVLLLILLSVTGVVQAQLSPGELSNAHAHLEGLTNCTKCHVLGNQETTSKCLECHEEIQNLIDRNTGYHAAVTKNGNECHDCHGEHFGRDFQIVRLDRDTFNHRLTGYELVGKHEEIACIDCHKPDLIQNNISQKDGQTWLGLGTECLDCHTDFHQNTLAANCLNCHNQQVFRPAPGFDHSETEFPLVGAHQETACEECHATVERNGQEFQQFAGVEFANCTACHEDVHQNKLGNDCRQCHNEVSFSDVEQLTAFNHEQTNYPLRGMHRDVTCADCHYGGSYTSDMNYNRCTDCHDDFHDGQFVENGVITDCAECHSVDGFSPTSYGIAEHNKTTFQLEGAHLATPCFACHKNAESWTFANIGSNCLDCHENVHKSYFDEKYLAGESCNNCHIQSTWSAISFDHSQTDFELQGEHNKLTCRECHFSENNNETTQQFTWENQFCTNCHEDIHFDQFAENGRNICERCHTFDNWDPEKFSHDDARFVLDGQHESLDCVSCHTPNDELTRNYIVYKFEDISCENCH